MDLLGCVDPSPCRPYLEVLTGYFASARIPPKQVLAVKRFMYLTGGGEFELYNGRKVDNCHPNQIGVRFNNETNSTAATGHFAWVRRKCQQVEMNKIERTLTDGHSGVIVCGMIFTSPDMHMEDSSHRKVQVAAICFPVFVMEWPSGSFGFYIGVPSVAHGLVVW